MKNLIVNNKDKSMVVMKLSQPNCPRMLIKTNGVVLRDHFDNELRTENLDLLERISAL